MFQRSHLAHQPLHTLKCTSNVLSTLDTLVIMRSSLDIPFRINFFFKLQMALKVNFLPKRKRRNKEQGNHRK